VLIQRERASGRGSTSDQTAMDKPQAAAWNTMRSTRRNGGSSPYERRCSSAPRPPPTPAERQAQPHGADAEERDDREREAQLRELFEHGRATTSCRRKPRCAKMRSSEQEKQAGEHQRALRERDGERRLLERGRCSP